MAEPPKIVGLVPPAAPRNAPEAPRSGSQQPPTGTDWNDPCVRADNLWDAYNRIISGQQESDVTYQANGVTRRVRYQQANLAMLMNAIREAENECAIQEGRPPVRRRFAIIAGSRRTDWPFGWSGGTGGPAR